MGTRLSINTGMCLLVRFLSLPLRTAIHPKAWLDADLNVWWSTLREKKQPWQQADEATEPSGHFPINAGVFSQVQKHKGRQYTTAPQYSCIASSFPFTKRQCDEKRLIRDENDLIRVSCYNGCQIELQRLTPASRLITVLQYRYSTNDVRVRADARLSLDEWSLQQVQTHMKSHPNHICNGSLTIRSECNGVARFTPTLITGNYEQRLFASISSRRVYSELTSTVDWRSRQALRQTCFFKGLRCMCSKCKLRSGRWSSEGVIPPPRDLSIKPLDSHRSKSTMLQAVLQTAFPTLQYQLRPFGTSCIAAL